MHTRAESPHHVPEPCEGTLRPSKAVMGAVRTELHVEPSRRISSGTTTGLAHPVSRMNSSVVLLGGDAVCPRKTEADDGSRSRCGGGHEYGTCSVTLSVVTRAVLVLDCLPLLFLPDLPFAEVVLGELASCNRAMRAFSIRTLYPASASLRALSRARRYPESVRG